MLVLVMLLILAIHVYVGRLAKNICRPYVDKRNRSPAADQ